jgi:hypothetical protein
MMSKKIQIDEARAWWLVIWAVMALGFVSAIPVQAQFVCAGSSDGGAPLTGGGATAIGSTANVACGSNASANGTGSGAANLAVGIFANAEGDNGKNVAVGAESLANGSNSQNTAIGSFSDAHGSNSANTANGFFANAAGESSFNTAIGTRANASGSLGSANSAIGQKADAHGDFSLNTAVGGSSNASGSQSENTASGASADAHGGASFNTATGTLANASGNNSSNVAMGKSADAHGDGTSNTAVGANSLAANNSSAFGAGAQAAFINSAAFGNGAKATRANQQVFGTNSNTYTMPGVTSAASKAAQSGPTQVVTTDAFGNLGVTAPSTIGLASGADLTTSVDLLSRRINKANTGVAMAFAMAGVPTVLPHEKFVFTTTWGTFQGENGAALSGAVRIYRNVQLQGSFAYGFRENMAGGHAGLRFGF